jgi:hypothetical protein
MIVKVVRSESSGPGNECVANDTDTVADVLARCCTGPTEDLIGQKRNHDDFKSDVDLCGVPSLQLPHCGLLSLWCKDHPQFWMSIVEATTVMWIPFTYCGDHVRFGIAEMGDEIFLLEADATFDFMCSLLEQNLGFPPRVNHFYSELAPDRTISSIMFAGPPVVHLLQPGTVDEMISYVAGCRMALLAHETRASRELVCHLAL